jgi:hypothetical protein
MLLITEKQAHHYFLKIKKQFIPFYIIYNL